MVWSPSVVLAQEFLVLVAGLFLAQGAVQVQAIWSLAQSKSPAACSGARQGGKQHRHLTSTRLSSSWSWRRGQMSMSWFSSKPKVSIVDHKLSKDVM